MSKKEPIINYLREHWPRVAAKAGPRGFMGWMHRPSFPHAPHRTDAEIGAAAGCLVLYAPKERFPTTRTLHEMRRDVNSTVADLARADDSIVEGARADGVVLDRKTFDPDAWAVVPDFEWPELETEAETPGSTSA